MFVDSSLASTQHGTLSGKECVIQRDSYVSRCYLQRSRREARQFDDSWRHRTDERYDPVEIKESNSSLQPDRIYRC